MNRPVAALTGPVIWMRLKPVGEPLTVVAVTPSPTKPAGAAPVDNRNEEIRFVVAGRKSSLPPGWLMVKLPQGSLTVYRPAGTGLLVSIRRPCVMASGSGGT